jgi:hypothetical protein
MKNIHILPTDRPSRLYRSDDDFILHQIPTTLFQMQNIYITSDEEIKEGDWCLPFLNGIVDTVTDQQEVYKVKNGDSYYEDKKIILTTDVDLIKDGVQSIDDEFLEWFVKNPSCESVEVENDTYINKDISESEIFTDYKIIIPKEEPCEHFTPTIGCIKDVCSCNKDPKKAPFKHECRVLSTEEVLANRSNAYEFIDFDKQETLEEAMNNNGYHDKSIDDIWREGVNFGVKWQQEQEKNKYSEEEVHKIIGSYQAHLTAFNTNFTYNNWFEQFKKK